MDPLTLVGLYIAVTLIQALIRPGPRLERLRPKGRGDYRAPTSDEDRIIPLVVGTVRQDAPNFVWLDDARSSPIKQKVRTGLFSSKRQIIGFRYYVGFQVGLCLGEVDELRRLWWGKEEVLDTPQVGPGTFDVEIPADDELGKPGASGEMAFYTGDLTQGVDPYLDQFQQIEGQTSAYKHLCYLVWRGGYVGNDTIVPHIKVELRRIPDGLDLATAHLGLNDAGDQLINGNDANPANWIYEILTNTVWGLRISPTSIDIDDFRFAGGQFANEGNGISMIIDTQQDAVEIIREAERQVGAFVYFDQLAGKWRINLSRGGYDVNDLLEITDAQVLEVESFQRAAWDDTTNEVRIIYSSRDRDYAESTASAQDMANVEMQEGLLVSAQENYPGVKDPDLANSIAWRQLRLLSFPLAKLRVKLDRRGYVLYPGDVVAYSSERLEITKGPFRVLRVDYGSLDDQAMTLDLVQDIFEARGGAYAAPPPPNWAPPVHDLDAFPADEQLILEAPLAFVKRDPDFPNVPNRIWAGARYQKDNATDFRIWQDSSGSYLADGTVAEFLFVGELAADIHGGHGTTGFPAIEVGAGAGPAAPDLEADILNAFLLGTTPESAGLTLTNLIWIDGEFISVRAAADGGTDVVDLSLAYRGMCGTAPKDHPAGSPVFLCFVGGGMSETALAADASVNVQLRARSLLDEVDEGDATTYALTMQDLARRPYPPVNMELNTDPWPDAVNIDDLLTGGSATNPDDKGLEVDFLRRWYDWFDEVENMTVDVEDRFGTPPAVEYRIRVIDDPEGTPTTIYTSAWVTDNTLQISRTDLLLGMPTPGDLPTRLRVEIDTRHQFFGNDLESVQATAHSFDADFDDLGDDFSFGVLSEDEEADWGGTKPTGTYTFRLGTPLSGGEVEADELGAGGGFATVIASGASSGTFNMTNGLNTLRIRYNGGLVAPTFLEVLAPSGTVHGWAILVA